jgi:large subunit ribosomal protein L13
MTEMERTMAAKTYMAKASDVDRKWFVVDAEGRILGRLAARIAQVLQGKHKPSYTPHVDTGDFVVVVNAEKVAVTGRKMTDKKYYRASGYPGGLKETTLQELLAKKPTEPVRLAVRRMLPKTKLGGQMLRKLKIYAGPDHPHAAQQPEPMTL